MPVFSINQQDLFPKMAPDEASPFAGVLSKAIAARLEMANAKKAESEAQYSGLSSVANAMSKGAYAAGMPIQNLVNTMKNSPQWANMTEEQREGAIRTVYNTATAQSGLSPVFNNLMQHELDKLNNPKKSSSFLDSLKSAIGINTNQQPNPAMQPSMQTNTTANNAQPAPMTTQATGFPSVPTERGDQPQSFINEQNYKSGTSQATSEGGEVGTQSAKQLEKTQSNSVSAQNMDQLIDSAVDKYKKSFLKGPGLGKLAKYGPDAAQALKDTNAMAVSMADQLFGAGSTDAKQATASSLKLNMEDPERAFDEFALKMKAQNDRFKWQGTFYQTAKQLGVTNPAERDQLWFDYNTKHPPYDYKKHEPIYENLGLDQNEMGKFITQDRANAKSLNKRTETTLKQPTGNKKSNLYAQTPEEWHSGKQAESSKMINKKRMVKIGGQWYEEE